MAGYLPFDEASLPALFKVIARAEYSIPPWFSQDMTHMLKMILNPDPTKRYAALRIALVLSAGLGLT
jgi:hypothetical protein